MKNKSALSPLELFLGATREIYKADETDREQPGESTSIKYKALEVQRNRGNLVLTANLSRGISLTQNLATLKHNTKISILRKTHRKAA